MSPSIVRVLDTDKPELPGWSGPKLLELYRLMVQARVFEERMVALQRQGRIAFFIGGMGEEACILGAAAGLEPEDWIVPSYREFAAAFYRGYPMQVALHQIMGTAEDPGKAHQMPCHYTWSPGNFFSVSSPVGTQIPQAAGMAWAMKLRGERKVALAFFGEGTTSQGDFHVGLNFAGVYKVPCLFVCRNNGYAISIPRSLQTASETIAEKAQAYGIEGVRVDGNDLLAMIAVVREAADRARAGGGPTLIEAITYRKGPHSTSDDPRVYRSDEEVRLWEEKDPILRMRRYLAGRGLWDDERDEALVAGLREDVLQVVKECEKVGPPVPETLFEDVFERPTPQLLEQREELLHYLASRPAAGRGGRH